MEKMSINVSDNLSVEVRPNAEYEFLMTSAEVAKGYGVSGGAIRAQLFRNREDFIPGKHYAKGVTICNDPSKSDNYNDQNTTFWTKRGVVRLGFFIKSDRARAFRDWAEDLVIGALETAEKVQSLGILPEVPRRKHNRLTPERMVELMADVARIEDKALRLSIVEKLTNHQYTNPKL